MLYTQQFNIPESGELRIGTIGGQPFEKVEGREDQVGFIAKPRYGVISIDTIAEDDGARRIFDARADVEGYYGRQILDCRVPGRIIVELPASVKVRGYPGTIVLVEAWPYEGLNDRGAAKSMVSQESRFPIPKWATSFDLAANSVATFTTPALVNAGIVAGPVVGFSIPSGASHVDITGTNIPIVFRQL